LNSAILRICADGSDNVTKITMVVNDLSINPNSIDFTIGSAVGDYYGEFLPPVVNGRTVTAFLRHPTYMNSNAPLRVDDIRIKNGSTVLAMLPVRIYRAPVLMVHGFIGSSSAFSQMNNYLLGFYPSSLLYIPNYWSTSWEKFVGNKTVVPTAILTLLNQALDANISAGKVDYIGHSMGGILGRIYLQELQESYKHDINKMITLNSPHSGTPLANIGGAILEGGINYLFTGLLIVNNSAISDLKVGSSAMKKLNGTPGNPVSSNNNVPSHTVSTKYTLIQGNPNNFANLVLNGASHFRPYQDVYNDAVVPDKSQIGGLSGSKTHELSGEQEHIGSPNNQYMQGYVFNLLKANPNGTTNIGGEYISFSQDGFHPPLYLTTPNTNEQESENKILATIQFNSPQSGATFMAGSTINIDVNGSANIQRLVFANKNDNTDLYSEILEGDNANIQFTIPTEAIGAMRMVAIGFDADSNYVAIDTVSINVVPNATPTYISSIYPTEKIFIPKYTEHSLTVKAIFSDGIERDISLLSNLTYSFDNPAMLREGRSKTIVGLQAGITGMWVQYQGVSQHLDIEIFESEYTNIGFTLQQNYVQSSCASGATGTASISAVESDTYTYQWSNGATTSTAYNLIPGVYTCTVTSRYNTQREIEVTIPAAEVVDSVRYDKPTCDNPNTNYTIATIDDPSYYNFAYSNGQSGTGMNTMTVPPYTRYYVTVTDTRTGCDETPPRLRSKDEEMQPINRIDVQNPSCKGGIGQVAVNVLGDPNNFSYQWSNGLVIQNPSNLSAGIYTVTVTHRTNTNSQCREVQNVVITDAPSLINSSTLRNIECATRAQGRILVNLAPCNCTYKWDDDVTTLNRYNLSVGLHTLSITNNAEECTETKRYTIGINNDLVATIDKVTPDGICTPNVNDGQIDLSVTGTPPYRLSFSNGIQSDSLVTKGFAKGSYLVNIEDKNGCRTRRTVNVDEAQCEDYDFIISTAIPNPFQEEVIIRYQLNEDNANITLSLYDVLGRELRTTIIAGNRGMNDYVLKDMQGLPNGVYVVKMSIIDPLHTETGINEQAIRIQKVN
jgi:pimeloyl-ACP methyl ester carboxylesterase